MQIQKNRNISLFLENQDMERGKKNAWKISRSRVVSNLHFDKMNLLHTCITNLKFQNP